MAAPTTLRGSKMLLKIGDGASPEVFTAPCALATKTFGRTASVNEVNVLDCDDPDAPAWVQRVKTALSSTITGSGTLAQEFLSSWEALYEDVDPRNVQIVLDYTVGPRTYQGAYLLTNFSFTGNQDGFVEVEIELQSSGEVGPI